MFRMNSETKILFKRVLAMTACSMADVFRQTKSSQANIKQESLMTHAKQNKNHHSPKFTLFHNVFLFSLPIYLLSMTLLIGYIKSRWIICHCVCICIYLTGCSCISRWTGADFYSWSPPLSSGSRISYLHWEWVESTHTYTDIYTD